jgi:Icc-related predicted phosphoesterase
MGRATADTAGADGYDEMKVIAISDDDSLIGRLDSGEVDVLLSLGDVWDATIEKAMARYRPKKVFAVRGNHDSDGPLPAGVTSLHLRVESFQGLTFGGFNGSWRYKPRGHYLYEQEEVSRVLRTFPRVDIFVAHNCPQGIHERDDDVHQGFAGFLEYIDRVCPAYFIHGHQHIRETTQRGETRIVGVFGETVLEIAKNSKPED